MATIKGGDKLEKSLREIAAKLNKPATLKAGFLEKAKYPDGTYVALVAAVQNFGSLAVGIPPRPFFTSMVQKKSPSWPAGIAKQLKVNKYDVNATLDKVGQGIKGQLQQSIRDTNTPPLSERTIARKGFDKPLIDTAHMLNSVDYEIDS